MIFLDAVRFIAGVAGTILMGGAVANLTQGSPLDRVLFLGLVGCIGVAVSDPRGRWQAFIAGLAGSFGYVGLVDTIRAFMKKGGQASWAEFSLWRFALYAMCLATFFVWATRRKRMRARPPEDRLGTNGS